MHRIVALLVFVVAVQIAALCEAANVIVVPGTNGVFYVRAVDFVDITGVEVELSYDATALANPRIAQGDVLASTMFVPNPKFKPNMVKFAAMSLSPFKSSGDLVILTFDLKGSAPGTVAVSGRPRLASSMGASIKPSEPTKIIEPTESTKPKEPSKPPVEYDSTTSVGVAGISMGTITLPQDQATSVEKKSEDQPLVTELRKDMTSPQGGESSSGKGAAAEGKQSDKSSVAYKSVLQLFKEFKGEKSAKSLVSLFAAAVYPDFKQEPSVALADGVKPVKLTLKLKPSGNESPKFMLQGAHVQQLRGEGEDYTWVVEAVPKKGVSEAKLTAIDGQRILEFPLAVAPAVDTALSGGAKTIEADFVKYLAKPAKYDLNKDGKFDYVDDYIYTANYIVAMKIKLEKLVDKTVKQPVPAKKDDKKKAEPTKQPEVKPGASDKGDNSTKGDKSPEKKDAGKNTLTEKNSSQKPATEKVETKEEKKEEKKLAPPSSAK